MDCRKVRQHQKLEYQVDIYHFDSSYKKLSRGKMAEIFFLFIVKSIS